MKSLLLIFLFPAMLLAQTHRFIYEFQYKPDSTQTEPDKDFMTLDINPEEVKFYPYDYVQTDSLNKVRGINQSDFDGYLPVLTRAKNSDKNTSYFLIDDAYLSLLTTDPIRWKLGSETKEMGGYHLQKATARFGGRDWTAWFTDQIPFQEGPYKFRGLPGLIFQISDSDHYFVFTLARSQNLPKTYDTSQFLESFQGQKATPVTKKIYVKKMLLYYGDPLHAFKEEYKNNPNSQSGYYSYGVRITSADQLRKLGEDEQQHILKSNNTIERGMMIHYPKS